MTNDLEFEIETEGVNREWGIHNGVVVLAALGLVALSQCSPWPSWDGCVTDGGA